MCAVRVTSSGAVRFSGDADAMLYRHQIGDRDACASEETSVRRPRNGRAVVVTGDRVSLERRTRVQGGLEGQTQRLAKAALEQGTYGFRVSSLLSFLIPQLRVLHRRCAS